jgi:hypothetical protein
MGSPFKQQKGYRYTFSIYQRALDLEKRLKEGGVRGWLGELGGEKEN